MCTDLGLIKSEILIEDLMHFCKFYFCSKTLMFSKQKHPVLDSRFLFRNFKKVPQDLESICLQRDAEDLQPKSVRAMKVSPSQVPEKASCNTLLADKSKCPEFHPY